MSKQQGGWFTIPGKYVKDEMELQMLNVNRSMRYMVLPSVSYTRTLTLHEGRYYYWIYLYGSRCIVVDKCIFETLKTSY